VNLPGVVKFEDELLVFIAGTRQVVSILCLWCHVKFGALQALY